MGKIQLTRRQMLKLAGVSATGLLLSGGAGYAYAREIEPGQVSLTRLNVVLPHLSPAFHGYRVVQISDIHADDWMTPARLEAIVQTINAEQPDLVAMTGDYLWTNVHKYADGLASVLCGLRPKDGTFAVLGNHDFWSGGKVVREVLAKAGVQELNNAVQNVGRGRERLRVAGLTSLWQTYKPRSKLEDHRERVERLAGEIPDGAACLLLAHEPDIADLTASTGRFGLQLSGHSHGGQVQMPLVGPLHLPQFARKYPCGWYRVGAMQLYTNRGLGMVVPRVRFNCPPEITVFTLTTT